METVSILLLVDKNAPQHYESLDIFTTLKEVLKIVVICEKEEQDFFSEKLSSIRHSFANPGKRRQDSIYQGLMTLQKTPSLVCIHELKEPISLDLMRRLCLAAEEHGAATVGLPISGTIKECDENQLVTKTLNSSFLWETKTPQVMKYHLLKKGFDVAIRHNLTVVDDASLIELMGEHVQIVDGTEENQKLTSESDISLLKQMQSKSNIKS